MNRNVFIKQDPAEETTSSGIFLPASIQDANRDNIGTVVLVGPGEFDEPIPYRIGDRVKFDPHAGIDMEVEGEDLKMIPYTDIYCIITS